MEENKKITLDDLATMVQNGFSELENKIEGKIDGIGKRIDGLEKKMDKMENDFEILKEGQERIELRLCNVAYKFDYVDLEKRVTVLEQKASARPAK